MQAKQVQFIATSVTRSEEAPMATLPPGFPDTTCTHFSTINKAVLAKGLTAPKSVCSLNPIHYGRENGRENRASQILPHRLFWDTDSSGEWFHSQKEPSFPKRRQVGRASGSRGNVIFQSQRPQLMTQWEATTLF